MMLPKAHMWLDHVYGYAGMTNTANNLYYTHNCSATGSEIVYYTGALGIVLSLTKLDKGEPCQRFFFGGYCILQSCIGVSRTAQVADCNEEHSCLHA